MLCEIESRALSAAHHMLVQDFEPKDALTYLEGSKLFTEDHSDVIKSKPTRLERLGHFLRLYRRQAADLSDLIDFFKYNNQTHISEFLDTFIFLSINDPDQLRPVILAPHFTREMLNRKLLLGSVPRQMAEFQRTQVVNKLIDRLDKFCDLDCFLLFLHGRAGVGKSVIAAQALAKSDDIVGLCYDSVIWLGDSGVLPKSTFDLYADLLLMLKSEDDLQGFPCIENVTSVVLKKMIANALIDRPNTLVVFDDVVLEDTVRWAQELRLRCLIITRDAEISNVATISCDCIEVGPMDDPESESMLKAYGFPMPTDEEEELVMAKTIELTCGNPAVLMMMNMLCMPKAYNKLAQLNNRMEFRGVASLECTTPYHFRSYDYALSRCVQQLYSEDREALAYAVVMPPGVEIPVKIWSAIIPVNICSAEESAIEEEVATRLDNLCKKGHFVTAKRLMGNGIVSAYVIDNLTHLFLRFSVDKESIRRAIQTLRNKLLEMSNNNNEQQQREQQQEIRRDRQVSGDYHRTEIFPPLSSEEYSQFMTKHQAFYNSLSKFVN